MTANTPKDPEAGLLPCPFCGDDGARYSVEGFVFCVCGASGPVAPIDGEPGMARRDAIAAWNTRALPAPGEAVAWRVRNRFTEGFGPWRLLMVEPVPDCYGPIEVQPLYTKPNPPEALGSSADADTQPDTAGSAGQWQPIETAPRDGTQVILCGWNDEGGPFVQGGAWMNGQWEWDSPWWNGTAPTHWMPLPAPPSEAEQ